MTDQFVFVEYIDGEQYHGANYLKNYIPRLLTILHNKGIQTVCVDDEETSTKKDQDGK